MVSLAAALHAMLLTTGVFGHGERILLYEQGSDAHSPADLMASSDPVGEPVTVSAAVVIPFSTTSGAMISPTNTPEAFVAGSRWRCGLPGHACAAAPIPLFAQTIATSRDDTTMPEALPAGPTPTDLIPRWRCGLPGSACAADVPSSSLAAGEGLGLVDAGDGSVELCGFSDHSCIAIQPDVFDTEATSLATATPVIDEVSAQLLARWRCGLPGSACAAGPISLITDSPSTSCEASTVEKALSTFATSVVPEKRESQRERSSVLASELTSVGSLPCNSLRGLSCDI